MWWIKQLTENYRSLKKFQEKVLSNRSFKCLNDKRFLSSILYWIKERKRRRPQKYWITQEICETLEKSESIWKDNIKIGFQ